MHYTAMTVNGLQPIERPNRHHIRRAFYITVALPRDEMHKQIMSGTDLWERVYNTHFDTVRRCQHGNLIITCSCFTHEM